MTKIKFRAKDLKTGEYHYGDLLQHENQTAICTSAYAFVYCAVKKKSVQGVFNVDPETVAQFVGYDKDGNELYEGDPVRDENGEGWVSLLGRASLQFKEIGATFDSQTLVKDSDVLFVRK